MGGVRKVRIIGVEAVKQPNIAHILENGQGGVCSCETLSARGRCAAHKSSSFYQDSLKAGPVRRDIGGPSSTLPESTADLSPRFPDAASLLFPLILVRANIVCVWKGPCRLLFMRVMKYLTLASSRNN